MNIFANHKRRIALLPAVAALLVCALTSSPILCGIVLPVISFKTGWKIEARKIDLRLFTAGRNVVIRNLKISNGKAIKCTAEAVEGRVGIFSALTGSLNVHDLMIRNADLLLEQQKSDRNEERPPDPTAASETESGDTLTRKKFRIRIRSVLNRFKIGSFSLQNCGIHFRDSVRKSAYDFTIIEFKGNGLRPGPEQHLHLRTTSALRNPDLDIQSLPLDADLTFQFTRQLIPTRLKLKLGIAGIRGTSVGYNLNPINVVLDIDSTWKPETEEILLNRFDLTQYNADKQEIVFRALGSCAPFTRSGHLDTTLSMKSARLFLTPRIKHFIPDDINMDYQSSILAKDGVIHYDGRAEWLIRSLYMDQTKISSQLQFSNSQEFDWDTHKKLLTIHSMKGVVKDQEKLDFRIFNSGLVTLSYADKQLMMRSNGAAVHTELTLPLERIPLPGKRRIESGTLHAKTKTVGDLVRQTAATECSYTIQDFSVRRLLQPLNLQGDFKLALPPDKRNLLLDHFRAKLQTAAGESAGSLDLNGNYQFRNRKISLDGGGTFFAETVSALLLPVNNAFSEARDAGNARKSTFQIETRYTGKIKSGYGVFQLDMPSLGFLSPELDQETLSVKCDATLYRNELLRVADLQAHAGHLLQLTAAGFWNFQKQQGAAKLPEFHLSTELVESVLRYTDTGHTFLPLLQRMRPSEILLQSDLAYSQKDRLLTASGFSANLSVQDKTHLTLTGETPVEFDFSRMKPKDCRLKLAGKDVDLTPINVFLEDEPDFLFRRSAINGTLQVNIRDFPKVATLTGQLDSPYFDFNVLGTEFYLNRPELTGEVAFISDLTRLELRNVAGRAFHGKKQVFDGIANGPIGLIWRQTTDLKFSFKNVQREFLLYTISPNWIPESWCKTADVRGDFRWTFDPPLDAHRFVSDLTAENWTTENLPRTLNGKDRLTAVLSADIRYAPDKLIVEKDSSVRVLSPEQTPILDLDGNGELLFNPYRKEPSMFHLSTRALAIDRIQQFLTDDKNRPADEKTPDPKLPEIEAPHPDEAVNILGSEAPAGPEPEPDPMDLQGLNSIVKLDLNHLTYQDRIQGSFRGDLRIKDNVLTLQNSAGTLNQAAWTLNGAIDLGKADGYPYRVRGTMRELELEPLLNTMNLNPIQEEEINCLLKSLELDLNGNGFRKQTLEHSLEGRLKLQAGKVSWPYDAKNLNLLTRILFIPVEFIPLLLEQLPDQAFKSYLHKTIGGTLNKMRGHSSIKFDRGEINLEMKDGTVRVHKFEFEGSNAKSEVTSGTIEPFRDHLNMETETRLFGLIFPMTIEGEIGDFKVTRQFWRKFMQRNAANLMTRTLSIFHDDDGKEEKSAPVPPPDTEKTNAKERTPDHG